MKTLILGLSVLFAFSSAFAGKKEERKLWFTATKSKSEKKLYVGSDSTEAQLKFTATVQIKSSAKPDAETVNQSIDTQVNHLFGPMSFAQLKGVPKGDHKITAKTEPKQVKAGLWSVKYTYTDTAVIECSGPISRGLCAPATSYELVLPVSGDENEIYNSGKSGGSNPCTDDHYQDVGDFWYFWNPYQAGCNMKEGKDFTVVKATIKRSANSLISYPEYERLVDSKNEIRMDVFFGMDEAKGSHDPNTSGDVNAENYRQIRTILEGRGYNVGPKWTPAQVREIARTTNSSGALPYVQDITKKVKDVTVRLRFYFGETGIDEKSTAFHWFYKDALETSSIMIYGGHSGLGGHLDLEAIEGNIGTRIQPNKRRYQIYFFDSCTSYTYYNKMYFGRKKTESDKRGSKNLDIMTNGLATEFGSMPTSTLKIITSTEKAISSAFEGTGLTSWQTIAKDIDSDNLFGVNGDEDNTNPND